MARARTERTAVIVRNKIDEVPIVKGKYGSSITEPTEESYAQLTYGQRRLLVREMARRAVAALHSSLPGVRSNSQAR